MRRVKVEGASAVYHCMTRTVNGEHLFGNVEKEVLRRMIWQVADFSGVEVLTYCVMANHFHVLVRVPEKKHVPDRELLRRYSVLYPRPTKYQTASLVLLKRGLAKGGPGAEAFRLQLEARMGDVSAFMKTLKQRFSIWYNRRHGRFGTLWADRFKSVLVEGKGNPLQTMAAYIDLNPVRAGLVEDPKDYRYCGYAEAVAQVPVARRGLTVVWQGYLGRASSGKQMAENALLAHRELIFGKRLADEGLGATERERALRVLEKGGALLPKATVLRCRVRYFTDGAILGSREFVDRHKQSWQKERGRKNPARANQLKGAEWGNLATIRALCKKVFA